MQSRPVRGLRGERVYLRPLESTDVELVHHWYEDVRVAALMGDPPMSLAARKARYEESVKAADPDVFRFIICLLVDDRRIGRTDLFDLDRQNGSCAFGITLGEPESWGQGLGTDAVNALVDFAFGQLRMERIWLDTDAHNERAQAAYAKGGFTQEGRFRNAWYQDGRWSDDLRMALLREEWEALPRPRSWDLIARAEQA
ncbi:MAG: GNAT family N-acetyltransferase [Actinomycetota bacterium]|nr:GNAT family N-acetyltransferase [Actinomycetota bacterium]